MQFTEWRKSKRSGSQSNCVMVRHNSTHVQVKDSKDPEGPVLTFTHDAWADFVGGAHGGEFDLD
ncbi:DUF397 domain-containing protein [Actinoplanes couchii]|uniref:DUF397 domain-containing protein n=1 Tax=Actinoplanes couchii TaxID=403638 RepID=A0ABQ3WZF4_9ACTN|nr:DUF397 domain-containing protein [Actinoplanes couchii]MDR6316044.1 hypothetical protein [Actinoplanes couchii]GID51658.1 hypothetical protein Aco03nite_000620 [Actinoplanes couchii]